MRTAEPGGWVPTAGLALALAGLLMGCGSPPPEESDPPAEHWSVTAWGERFEVFAEVDPLVAGEVALAHTHVTDLAGFSPVAEARVEIVLGGPDGERVFAANSPVRAGIFSISIEPEGPGDFELAFRIRDSRGTEEIQGGDVRVGAHPTPGSLLAAPVPAGGSDGAQPLAFLKEEQWRSDFATAWVRSGPWVRSVAGVARVRPPAGGETTLTAPVHGVVQPPSGPGSWPFVGLRVDRGDVLLRVVPLVAPDKSLATLEADLVVLAAELETARRRRARLEELLVLEATSRREVEEARARVEILEARRSAAARDLGAARASRTGGRAGAVEAEVGLRVRAPFAGEVAEVTTSPGSTVSAGDPLARVVRTDVVWIDVALPPGAAAEIAQEGVRGLVLSGPQRHPLRIEEGVRLVAVAPELSAHTGTVTVLLEAARSRGLALGTALEAQILSSEERDGIVVPTSALVDDGGVPVVYLQLGGETFARQEVQVLERQGDLLLVEHLTAGQRLVTRGGEAIRRSSLMTRGEPQGHVH